MARSKSKSKWRTRTKGTAKQVGQKFQLSSRASTANLPKNLKKTEGTSRKTLEHYTITFYYSKGRQETVHIGARDADDALNQALKARKRKNLKPISMHVKDGLGDVLAKVAKGAGYTVAQYQRIKRSYTSGKLENLISEAQSDNMTNRAIARTQLKRMYPEIFKYLALDKV